MKFRKKIFFTTIIVLSIISVGCNKNTKEPEQIEVNILESQKERPKKEKKEIEYSETTKEPEVINEEEVSIYKDIEINTNDVTTYTYFSLKEFPSKMNSVIEIDSYQDWLTIKTNNPEVFSLVNQELLSIEESYFSHSKGFLIIDKTLENNKFINTSKIIKQGNSLGMYYSQKEDISTINKFENIIDVIPNFKEKVKETAVIYFFNRTDVEDVVKEYVTLLKEEESEEENKNIDEIEKVVDSKEDIVDLSVDLGLDSSTSLK